jgi:hypothetical protein
MNVTQSLSLLSRGKGESMKWRQTGSSTKFHAKVMAIAYWDSGGIFLVDYSVERVQQERRSAEEPHFLLTVLPLAS